MRYSFTGLINRNLLFEVCGFTEIEISALLFKFIVGIKCYILRITKFFRFYFHKILLSYF